MTLKSAFRREYYEYKTNTYGKGFVKRKDTFNKFLINRSKNYFYSTAQEHASHQSYMPIKKNLLILTILLPITYLGEEFISLKRQHILMQAINFVLALQITNFASSTAEFSLEKANKLVHLLNKPAK
jgi:hypothetical protein